MLKQALQENRLTLGSWVTIGHQSVVEIMASAGFDWLCIDMEHSAIGLESAQNLIGHIQGNGMKALVRVGKNEEVIIKRIMDAGADGIIVPMVNSKEDAERAVAFAKYPPKGKRGVGLARAQSYGTSFEEYKSWLDTEAVIIAQIEHKDATDNIEEIIQVDGIDGIIVGPYDLSGSMGVAGQLEHPDLLKRLDYVIEICKKHNFPYGYHVIQPDHKKLKEFVDGGYTFLAFSIDYFFLGNKAREEMAALKDS